jgi:hypothetical protein
LAVDKESGDDSDQESDSEPDAKSDADEVSAGEEMDHEYEDLRHNVSSINGSIQDTFIDEAAKMMKRLNKASAVARRAAQEDQVRLGLIGGGPEDEERKKAADMKLINEGLDEIQEEAQTEEDRQKQQQVRDLETRMVAADARARQSMAAQMTPPGGLGAGEGYEEEQQQQQGIDDDEGEDLEFEDVPIAGSQPSIAYPADGFNWDEDDGAPLILVDP